MSASDSPRVPEAAQPKTAEANSPKSGEVRGKPSLKGYSLDITVEDGYYLKAYANPPEGGGIVSYGFQATISRQGVRDALMTLVREYLEDNGG